MDTMTNNFDSLKTVTSNGLELDDFYDVTVTKYELAFQGKMSGMLLGKLKKLGFDFDITNQDYLEGTFNPNGKDGELVSHMELVKITLT